MRIELNKVQKILEWVRRKIYLETIVGNAGKRMVKRGQVYRCDFGVGIGSEMQKDRPAIIVQNDIGNIHSSNTIVIPITHTQHDSPCVVTIAPKKMVDGEVILDGCANASNIMCISKARLGNYIATLSQSEMKQVDEAVAKSMGMMHYYADLKKKYFTQVGPSFQISNEIKSRVEFKKHNLLKDPYPTGCHLIVCRNVVIYFTDDAKNDIYNRFYDDAKPIFILYRILELFNESRAKIFLCQRNMA